MKNALFIFILIQLSSTICLAQEAVKPKIEGARLKEEVSTEAVSILRQAHKFEDQGKTGDALNTLIEALLKFKDPTFDRYSLLNYKFELLSSLSNIKEALDVAIEKANIVISPRQALNVAKLYLAKNDLKNALEWLEASVQRGLQSYTIFDEDIYKPLADNDRFRAIVETIKKKNGLGLPAQAFATKTINGIDVSLDKYKGKVLLLDFWATWCPPCVAEMPNMKKCYDEYKNMGYEIIGFASEDIADALKDFLPKNSIEWPIVANNNNNYQTVAQIYKVSNIPASFLIDKKGILRFVNLTGEKLRKAIEELMHE